MAKPPHTPRPTTVLEPPRRHHVGFHLTERLPPPPGVTTMQVEVTKGSDVRVHVRVSLWNAKNELVESLSMRLSVSAWRILYLPASAMVAKSNGWRFRVTRSKRMARDADAPPLPPK